MKNRILVVDDLEINRDILSAILEKDYDIVTAADGNEAIEVVKEQFENINLILLDLMMPGMDGFDVLNTLKKLHLLKHIPIIVITGDDSIENQKKCFKYGVVDFLRKPFDSDLVKLRVGNVLELFSYKNNLEIRVVNQTKKLQKQYSILQKQAQRLEESNQKIIDILGTVVESRNLESGQHIQRVKTYTRILAKQLMEDYPEYGLNDHIIEVMVLASALHDVGKIAIPDNILLKPGRLTNEEFEIMKLHTTRGCTLLDSIEGAWDEEYAKMSYDICRHHHERFDGNGYPDKLSGDDIPIAAQIVSIADVYDALINKRVYKDAYAKEMAYNMIMNGECGNFSPKILACYEKTKEVFEAVGE